MKARAAQRGRYQFQRPARAIVEGKRSPRTSVMSITIAAARPKPSCCMVGIEPNIRPLNVAAMISPAAVTITAGVREAVG